MTIQSEKYVDGVSKARYNRIRAIRWFTIHTDWINPLARLYVRNRGEG
ncbi:MAG: hypothetical protein GXX10_09475 [Clostridiaceae bacterium]|nr:hypothetical protein [Clostridiaceae bacterium]